MLLEFTVGNFLSFKEPITLSMEAASISEFPESTFQKGRHTLLKSAVIYGANASGKSNLIKAFSVMEHIVLTTAKMASTDTFNVTPFLLCTDTIERPCFFEILILIDDLRYRYGFEISETKVHTEWLYQSKAKVEKPLFIRDGEAIEVSTIFPEGDKLEPKTRENALFLGVCDQFNGAISAKILKWFANTKSVSGLRHEDYRGVTFHLLKDEKCRPAMLEFLEKLDLGFKEVRVQEDEFNPENLPDNLPLATRLRISSDLKGGKIYSFLAKHDVFGLDGSKQGEKEFNLDQQESAGTNKLFDLLGPIFHALINGELLFIDELDAKLHPLLTKALVGLFNSTENNRLNAQLIFVSHDTNLLSYGDFRRDQIYFIEKDREGASDLYSLVEYQVGDSKVRKDRKYEKDYVEGKYGGIPYLGDFSQLFQKWQEKQKLTTT